MRPHLDHPQPGQTDESTDTYDTVQWLLQHIPGNNGNAGIWGMSYPGFYTAASIIDSHPAIKACSPQAPLTNDYQGDDAYHNGAFMLAAQFQFYAGFFEPRGAAPVFPGADYGSGYDYGTEDGYRFFSQHGPALRQFAALIHNPYFDQTIQHNTYDGYWQARDISTHLHGIHCAVLNVGGWFDAEDLAGTFRTYHAIGRDNPGVNNSLVMGPWTHVEWVRGSGTGHGPLHFHTATADVYREQIVFPFFEHFLKGKQTADLPAAYVFDTGTDRWQRYDTWPPRNTQPLAIYLHAGAKLSLTPPAASESAYDEYVSDPRHPVPYVEHPSTDLDADYMFADQRFTIRRPDVLTYTSDPLAEDITLTGPVSPQLQVSSTGTDSDFDVKLIDVLPEGGANGGYAQLVRGEPMRARFRNGFSSPEAMVPGQITPLRYDMPDVNHTFQRGHRIMVQIQSTWFPLTDINPQQAIDTSQATPADFVTATERIYHTPAAPSRILVPRLQAR